MHLIWLQLNLFFFSRPGQSQGLLYKLDHVWSCLHTLSKPWENFMFLKILSIRNMGQHKAQFTHLFVTNLLYIFMWVQLVKIQLKIWKKLWPLTIDHSGDNEDSIRFFMFSYLQWNMVTTSFTSTISLCPYHESLPKPWVHVCTMSPCLNHESMSIPWVHVCTIRLIRYHESISIPWVFSIPSFHFIPWEMEFIDT